MAPLSCTPYPGLIAGQRGESSLEAGFIPVYVLLTISSGVFNFIPD
jgi:hypothetical protein